MWFTNRETRAKHNFIDRSIGNTIGILQCEETSELIGRVTVENAVSLLSDCYVPNIRHGKLSIPRSRQRSNDNGIPTVALQPGERVIVPSRASQPTELQLFVAAKKACAWYPGMPVRNVMEKIENEIDTAVDDFALDYIPTAQAYVVNGEFPLIVPNLAGKTTRRFLRARPVMNFQIHDSDQPRIDPSVVLHEAVHLEQVILDPLKRYNNQEDHVNERYRRELHAYHRQAWFIEALVKLGYEAEAGEMSDYSLDGESKLPKSEIAVIDNLRAETNARRKDKFFPNGTLKNRLDEIGIDIV